MWQRYEISEMFELYGLLFLYEVTAMRLWLEEEIICSCID